MPETRNKFSNIIAELKETLKLNIDYAKLTIAEKMSLLLTAFAFAAVAFIILSIVLLFLSLAVVSCIAESIGAAWAYLIVCGFYLIVLAVIVGFRKQLIINPISRFVSRLFFNP